MATFNPDRQRDYCTQPDRCIMGSAPSLATIRNAYGFDTAELWVCSQLRDLNDYAAANEAKSMDVKQLDNCASVIASRFGHLTITELMLFFHKFKAGDFGEFYGAVNALRITARLKEFVKWRDQRKAALETKAENARRAADQEKAINWQQYCEARGLNPDLMPYQPETPNKPP